MWRCGESEGEGRGHATGLALVQADCKPPAGPGRVGSGDRGTWAGALMVGCWHWRLASCLGLVRQAGRQAGTHAGGGLLERGDPRCMSRLSPDTAPVRPPQVVVGGRLPSRGGAGQFYPPTIVAGVTPAMRIWQEEVFGPVMAGEAGCRRTESCWADAWLARVSRALGYSLCWCTGCSAPRRRSRRSRSRSRAAPRGAGPVPSLSVLPESVGAARLLARWPWQ